MQEYAAGNDLSSFDRSREVFESVIGALSSADADAWTHGELEVFLDERGRELLRQLAQDRLDLGAVRERRVFTLGRGCVLG
jgi:hypothetical protein